MDRRQERLEQQRRLRRWARPLFGVLLVVAVVLAPWTFIDARRDGEFISWFTFVSNVLTAALSVWMLWMLTGADSSGGGGPAD